MRRSVYGINIIGGEARVLSSISLLHVLDVEPSGGGDGDAGVVGQGRPVTLRPGHPRLRLARGAALQGHALPHQDLRVLGLDHKTGPCWRSRQGNGGDLTFSKIKI